MLLPKNAIISSHPYSRESSMVSPRLKNISALWKRLSTWIQRSLWIVSNGKCLLWKVGHWCLYTIDQKITALIPKDNTNEEWDSLMHKIQTAENDFDKHLRTRRRELKYVLRMTINSFSFTICIFLAVRSLSISTWTRIYTWSRLQRSLILLGNGSRYRAHR